MRIAISLGVLLLSAASASAEPPCPFWRAAYENMRDPRHTIYSELTKERGFMGGLKLHIKNGVTGKDRAYRFNIANGTGEEFLVDQNDDEKMFGYFFFNEKNEGTGIGSADDPAPPFLFIPDLALAYYDRTNHDEIFPAAMWRRKSCGSKVEPGDLSKPVKVQRITPQGKVIH